MVRVERVQARVTLDDPAPTVARAQTAAREGDESWTQWLTEYERGEALIVRLEVTVVVGADEQERVEIANRGVFIEKDPNPPKVEQQVAEITAKDFSLLARELTTRGYRVSSQALGDMYVHVELADEVRRELTGGEDHGQMTSGGLPDADASLSEPEQPASS